MVAEQNANIAVVSALVAAGADVNSQGEVSRGEVVRRYMCVFGHVKTSSWWASTAA